MAKFNDKDGHWYTDDNGNHYFVGDGESPKEGWEKTKRRKMIDGGKYKVDDGDGKGSREVSVEEYDKYEAEDADFDATTDDDFGFDADDRPAPEQDLENEEIWDADYERSYGPYNFDAWDDVEMLKKAYEKAKDAGMDDSAQNALERIEELGGEFDADETDNQESIEYEGYRLERTKDGKWINRDTYEYYDTKAEAQKSIDDYIAKNNPGDNKNENKAYKNIEDRAKDIDQLRKLGWDNDRIINEFVKQGYDKTEVSDFVNLEENARANMPGNGERRNRNLFELGAGDPDRSVTFDADESDDLLGENNNPGGSDNENSQPAEKAEPLSTETIEKEVHSYKGGIEGLDEHIKDICDKYGCRFITSNKINNDTVEVCIGGVTGNEWFRITNTGSNANPYWYGGSKLVDYIKKTAERSEQNVPGADNEAPKPKKTDEQKKAAAKAKAKAKREKEIQSMGKEIVEYYNGDPIDEDEVADILGGEYGYNQRMVNAIIKWVKENQ